MKIKTPLTANRLRNHFTYHWWKYLLVVVASVFGWNLLYTTTAYRSPEHLRIDVYVQSQSTSDEQIKQFFAPIWQSTVPDMETVSSVILTGNAKDAYSNMQLSVYIMAGEGDIYMLSSGDFKSYAAQGAFIDLQPLIDEGVLNVDGIDLSGGYVAVVDDDGIPTGTTALYGIPMGSLYGFMEGMHLDNRDLVMSITVYNGNEGNVAAFMNGLIEAGRGDAPEWLNP